MTRGSLAHAQRPRDLVAIAGDRPRKPIIFDAGDLAVMRPGEIVAPARQVEPTGDPLRIAIAGNRNEVPWALRVGEASARASPAGRTFFTAAVARPPAARKGRSGGNGARSKPAAG